MKANRLIITILILELSFVIFSQTNPEKLNNNSFKSGENLGYLFKYGFIEAGTARLYVNEENYEGKTVYHAVGIGKTTDLVDKIFGVYDVFESYFDEETGLPYKKKRTIKEGNYKYYNEATFDRQNNIVTSLKSGKHKVPEYILDMVSVFYYLRCKDFSDIKEGTEIKMSTYFDDRIFPFEVIYRGKEIIKTKWGYIQCKKFAPVVEPGKIFKSKDDMIIWFSDDKNCIPIKVSFEMWVGSFVIELNSYENLKNDIHFYK